MRSDRTHKLSFGNAVMREQQSIRRSNHEQVPAPARWFAIHFIAIEQSDHRQCRLLSPRRERPSGSGRAKQRYKFPPFHSTSLVGANKKRYWHFETKRPCSLEVDDQFQLGRPLDRKVGRLGQTYSSISSGSIAALAMLQARLPLLIAAIALAQVRIALLLGTYSGAVGRELRKSGKFPGLRNRSARNNRSICCGADQTSVGPSGNLRPAARTSDQV
jgi:hypothetical protein